MRKYFIRDFYQLLSQPENMQNWCAYQAHDPDLNEGFFIAFRRRQSPSDKQMLNLSGIDKNAVYVMEDKNGKTSEIKGDKLKDIIVTLPPRSYAVFFYSQKK